MAAPVQDVFMLFGDSITQRSWTPGDTGIGQRLAHLYARKLDVLNRGFSGYNTDWALPVFEQCLAKAGTPNVPKVRVLTIWFGANDACLVQSPQHVPLATFTANIGSLVDMVHSPASPYYSPDTKIILMTPPPVNTIHRRADLQSRDPPVELDRDFETTRQYAEAVKSVASEKGVAAIDCWTLMWEGAGKVEANLDKYLSDGLHLNEAGYEIVYEELIKVLATRYPEVHYDTLGFAFPSWQDIIDSKTPVERLRLQRV